MSPPPCLLELQAARRFAGANARRHTHADNCGTLPKLRLGVLQLSVVHFAYDSTTDYYATSPFNKRCNPSHLRRCCNRPLWCACAHFRIVFRQSSSHRHLAFGWTYPRTDGVRSPQSRCHHFFQDEARQDDDEETRVSGSVVYTGSQLSRGMRCRGSGLARTRERGSDEFARLFERRWCL